jgi:hypothetical protein
MHKVSELTNKVDGTERIMDVPSETEMEKGIT